MNCVKRYLMILYELCKAISPQCKSMTNVLIRHVREWKHQKYSPWACPFSGVKFCGAFHFQKMIFLQLLQIWSSYCFNCDTDQLWTHTQSNNKTKCFKQILLTVKNPTPICAPFGTKSYICNIVPDGASAEPVLEPTECSTDSRRLSQ